MKLEELIRKKGEEKLAEQRELEKLLPLHPTKMRKRVAKSKLWSRSEREELSKMAEEFLKKREAQE
jgi:hypothetical protein